MEDLETDNIRLVQNAQEVDLSDETQDFRFLDMFSRSKTGAKTEPTLPKRGEKDFEPDGTDLQSRILSDSRTAMHNALSGARTHTSRAHIAATWRPSRGMAEVEQARGAHFKAIGKADREGRTWLEPEETVYMVERGGMECWWEEGVPMSLQGVYAECLGGVGAVGIERYQVYAYLKRAGFIVQRASTFFGDEGIKDATSTATPVPQIPTFLPISNSTYHPPHPSAPLGMFPALYHALTRLLSRHPLQEGPVIKNTTYRSYPTIYTKLSLVPCHHPSLGPSLPTSPTFVPPTTPNNLLRITYNVYKPRPNFRKSDPGPPDFRIVVLSTAQHPRIPTIVQIAALFDSVPFDDGCDLRAGNDAVFQAKHQFQRLKDGRKSVVLAVVDAGVISFMKLADVGFGDEFLYLRKPGGGKKGGKGGTWPYVDRTNRRPD
ncbi:tRNA-splicing endonuclease subunit sen54 N-term-domain-containing protein [Kalaharituber pfeilii]|nr:tRNA-splicing endonuclease subunit sen54 N-term-domain-containing protein [Kalaharituber pfeilii]